MSIPPLALDPLTLERDGAQRFPAAASAILPALERLFDGHPPALAGTRLFDDAALPALLATDGAIASLAERLLGPRARPVRAILFDKSATDNWGIGWHQDRVIAVQSRAQAPGFTRWSVKRGVDHVSPPWPILAAMRTLRVHLDPAAADNGVLLVAPGSHRLGIIAERDIDRHVARLGMRDCPAEAGDVWAYATPILHASAPSASTARRRVLQLDYAATDLPAPLAWRGV